MMEKVEKVLDRVIADHRMYIGKDSLVNLRHFLGGYITCAMDHDLDFDFDGTHAFQAYIEKRFPGDYGAIHWTDILRQSAESEESAFELFKSVYEDYKNRL